MLFDLRGRGRRRTVQAIYLSLALLMGGGLVFFGIGGDVQGGLADAIRGDGTAVEDIYSERIDAAEKKLAADPQDAPTWANLAKLRFQQAGTGENFNQSTGAFTDGGLKELRRSEIAWDKYLALDPKKPDDRVANLMVQAFIGLNKLPKAVQAMEIVVDAREPTPQLFVQLATYAYAAGQTRKGDLAAGKAEELAKPEDREQIKAQLQSAKTQAAQAAAQGAGAAAE
ncbi:hypothetical protein [Paraconexibacter algicola]|uniref:Tetratricopeptide repeat protein n=1 Tax=Paraconexibacter algicola TaxID=2133960 RepID=A0A2T4UJ52_9ACTN|nr:hypothetical protein [Paraconexibacter algicola]PTL59266.1 hypothetical protein C7Y72_06170 [Paraconexibacter algicola]